MHVMTINEKKRPRILKSSRRGIQKTLEGRKGRGKKM